MPIRIVRDWRKSDMRGSKRKNTPRENRLEELGRVDAEKAWTRGGKRNLKDEKKRIVKEITDPKRKEELHKKLKNIPKHFTQPGRKLTEQQKKILKKHFERKKDVLTKGPGPLRQRSQRAGGGMAQRGLGRAFMKGGKA